MIVVADTSPINYLVQFSLIDVLAELYESVLLPTAVVAELRDDDAPPSVRRWTQGLPEWCRVATPTIVVPAELVGLDPGETEALRLAMEVGADLVLVDELDARKRSFETLDSGARNAGRST